MYLLGKIGYFLLPLSMLFIYLYVGIRQWRNKDKNWELIDKLMYLGGFIIFGIIIVTMISSYGLNFN